MQIIAPASVKRKYALKSPFTPCPICGGTTSMEGSVVDDKSYLYFYCYSCNSKWNLNLQLIEKGEIVRMPRVNNNNRQGDIW